MRRIIKTAQNDQNTYEKASWFSNISFDPKYESGWKTSFSGKTEPGPDIEIQPSRGPLSTKGQEINGGYYKPGSNIEDIDTSTINIHGIELMTFGNDVVNLFAGQPNEIGSVTTGYGQDQVSVGGELTIGMIDTGNGNDTVNIYDGAIVSSLNTGSGDDTATVDLDALNDSNTDMICEGGDNDTEAGDTININYSGDFEQVFLQLDGTYVITLESGETITISGFENVNWPEDFDEDTIKVELPSSTEEGDDIPVDDNEEVIVAIGAYVDQKLFSSCPDDDAASVHALFFDQATSERVIQDQYDTQSSAEELSLTF